MSNELQAYKPDAVMMPGQSEWTIMQEMAHQLLPTNFLPAHIKTEAQAVAIMLKGRELRIPPMQALSNISIIGGKPVVSAELMLALIYRDHGKQAIRVKSTTDTECVVEYRLEGWSGTSEYAFTIAQAKAANLMKNPVWNSYPAAMLRARCISAVARMAYPESISGMYVPGELGDAVAVDDDGVVYSANIVDPTPITAQAQELDPAIQEAKIKVWDLAFKSYKWGDRNKEACAARLDEVSVFFKKAPLKNLDAEGLEELHRYMVNMEPDEREAVKDGTPLETVFPIDIEQATLV